MNDKITLWIFLCPVQSTQTTLEQTTSWVLWLWVSAGKNWTTPKTWKTSTSTGSSSELVRYEQMCVSQRECAYYSLFFIYLWLSSPYVYPESNLPPTPHPSPLYQLSASGKFHLPGLRTENPNQTLLCSAQSVWPTLRESTPNHFSTLMDQILLKHSVMDRCSWRIG